ncbi:MAG: hypothetical protein AAF725_03565 [Acidobacteriota bacterium]
MTGLDRARPRGAFEGKGRPLPRWPWLVVTALLLGGAYGWISVELGQDANWDLLNYHFYNPWAFLHDRLDQDIAPAQLQTYLNPLLDLPAYWLMHSAPPRAVGAALGALHGLNAWLLGWIAWAFFRSEPRAVRAAASVACAGFGSLGLEAVNLIGRTTNDNLVSLFGLTALLILISDPGGQPHAWRWAAAGLILGAGTGLKLTLAIHAVAFGLLAALAAGPLAERLRRVALAGLSGLVGVLATSGFWLLTMQEKFGNPFYPFWNGVFSSPYFGPYSANFYHYIPGPKDGWLGALLFPAHFALEPELIHAPGHDFRFAACLLVTALALAAGLIRRRLPDWRLGALVVFMGVSYVLWVQLFHYSRMLLVVEMLAGLYLLALASRLLGGGWRSLVPGALLLLLLMLVQDPKPKGRLIWAEDFFGVEVPARLPENLIVLLTDGRPLGYIPPHFPHSVRWIHLEGSLARHTKNTEYERWIERELREHTGAFMALVQVRPGRQGVRRLPFGMRVDTSRCLSVNARLYRDTWLCAAFRKGEKPAPLPSGGPSEWSSGQVLFSDGFEGGTAEAWSAVEGEEPQPPTRERPGS